MRRGSLTIKHVTWNDQHLSLSFSSLPTFAVKLNVQSPVLQFPLWARCPIIQLYLPSNWQCDCQANLEKMSLSPVLSIPRARSRWERNHGMGMGGWKESLFCVWYLVGARISIQHTETTILIWESDEYWLSYSGPTQTGRGGEVWRE